MPLATEYKRIGWKLSSPSKLKTAHLANPDMREAKTWCGSIIPYDTCPVFTPPEELPTCKRCAAYAERAEKHA